MMRRVHEGTELLRRSPSILKWASGLNRQICRLLYSVSPRLLIDYRHYLARGYFPNLKTPKTFDEKLLWLMLFNQDPLKSQCADKYGLRTYVQERGWGHALPKLLGLYESVSDVPFDTLPDRFVLKCTHGYNANIICRDKSELDVRKAQRNLREWMGESLWTVTGELHYSKIRPRVICEELLDDSVNEVPIDYKVYCFGGKAHCTMVCTERGVRSAPILDFYDIDWKAKLPYFKAGSGSAEDRLLPKPLGYDEMIECAQDLSKPFHFVRVDFYDIQGRVVVGEMTFTPHGCIDLKYTNEAQLLLGQMIVLEDCAA